MIYSVNINHIADPSQVSAYLRFMDVALDLNEKLDINLMLMETDDLVLTWQDRKVDCVLISWAGTSSATFVAVSRGAVVHTAEFDTDGKAIDKAFARSYSPLAWRKSVDGTQDFIDGMGALDADESLHRAWFAREYLLGDDD